MYGQEVDVAKGNTSDHGLVALVEDVFAFGTRQTAAEVATRAEIPPPAQVIASKFYQVTPQVLLVSPKPPVLSEPHLPRKELKTAAELAAMIELDPAQHPDCPQHG